MALRLEFDPLNKILMVRVEGPGTGEVVQEARRAARKHSIATGASAGIMDFSSVTEFPISSSLVGEFAKQEPAFGNIPRILVAPSTVAFGLGRLFQLAGEPKTSGMEVVRTLDEAFAALGVQSPHFEPLG
jgi:hypothetical protein